MTSPQRQHGFPRAAIITYHKLGGLRQQKCIIPQFWRLEVQKQGISRALLPLKPITESFLASS